MARNVSNSQNKVASYSQGARYCRVVSNAAAHCNQSVCEFPPPQPHIERVHADSKIFFNGVGYCSLSEAALGALLELYVPGFRIIEGLTFQIPIGEGRSVDFFINGTLVEYHQPRINPEKGRVGDYKSRQHYKKFMRTSKRLGNDNYRRERLLDETRLTLGENYFQKRRRLLDSNAVFRQTELIVATSREDFFQRVILRFATNETPTYGEFLARFWWWVNIIAKQNGLPPLKKSYA